jgi:hypothetical protein
MSFHSPRRRSRRFPLPQAQRFPQRAVRRALPTHWYMMKTGIGFSFTTCSGVKIGLSFL